MKSMTGFGTAEGKVGKGRLFVEIKSVNHRFSEFSIKIPSRMGVLEARIRKVLTPLYRRGKVDVFFREKESLFGGTTISIDKELAQRYRTMLRSLKRELKLKEEPSFLGTVGLDRILRVEEREGSYERLWGQIATLLKRAATSANKMRVQEGAHIKRDQKQRLDHIRRVTRAIRKQSDHALDAHLKRLRKKASGMGGAKEAGEQRLQMEVSYLSGRQDIAEELVRLESHAKQYAKLIDQKEPVGRKLDFLLQEMNREINTIGSKGSDAKISQLVVDAKSELERLREQIQNVE